MNHRSIVVLLACAGSLGAAEPTPAGKETGLIPRHVLFGNPDKASPQISPDGRFLSYLAPVDGVMNVWVAPVAGLNEAKPVTKDDSRGIRSYFWAYTNDHILYTQDTGGDENFHVYSVDLPSGEVRDLTPYEGVRAQIDGVSSKFPGEILVGLNDRTPSLHDLYRIDVTTGERKLVQKNTGFLSFVTDDDFRVRRAIKFGPDGGTIVYEPDGQDWVEVEKVPMEDTLTTRPVAFDRTGRKLYMTDSRGRDTAALTVLDTETGESKVLAESPKADAGTVLMHPTERNPQGVAFNHTRLEYTFFDDEVTKDFEALRELADGDITLASRTENDRTWVVSFVRDDGPVANYLFDRDAKEAKFLFTNSAELADWKLRPMEPVVVKSRDGLDLVCYLTRASGPESGEPAAMVLFVHGGPWARDSWGLNPYHQFLANRGYSVLSVNYRGSTGFGKSFLNAGNREWAGKMHDDLIDAVEWAVGERIADPKKVAIMGGSYGGYATLVGLTFTPDTFACGVDIVGPSNIITLLKTIPPYWAPAIEQFKTRVGDPFTDEGQAFLKERSPLTHVDRIRKPLLIGQGANDPRVKQAESDQIVEAMRAKKIPVTYVLFPDEGHGFARPENRLAFNAIAEAFLAEHLGGRYEAIGSAFEGSSVEVVTGKDGVPGLED